MEQLLGILVIFTFMCLWISVPIAIVRKMGYPAGLGLLIAITGYLGVIFLAFVEWPIEKELSWLRFKQGNSSDDLVGKAEAYAILLENRGELRSAE